MRCAPGHHREEIFLPGQHGGRRGGSWPLVFICLIGSALLWPPLGCTHNRLAGIHTGEAPIVRVRILAAQQQVLINASEPPSFKAASERDARRINFPHGGAPVRFNGSGWQVGSAIVAGAGELIVKPAIEGSVYVNGAAYRGHYALVPLGNGTFDVVNVVDVDAYLKSVIPKEMPRGWETEAYRAQAIVARTYALYEKGGVSEGRHFHLYADQRSQVYGGIASETRASRAAVDDTAGVVVAYGPKGRERIFKAYFSSCCGGITQTAYDAFGETYMEPLSDQNVGSLCNDSPKFNWGPVVLRKDELTRRFRTWGARRNRPEKDMAAVRTVEVSGVSRFGRPVRFDVIDARGQRYRWLGEELRWAVNTDPPQEAGKDQTLPSSFCRVVDAGDSVQFVDGHGWGHGVGMCQWCAQARAEAGMAHEDIVLSAYPKSKLVRAY